MNQWQCREKKALLIILILSVLLRIIVGLAYPRIHHPDELFQYLEQGHRLAFGYGVIPFEFRESARTWLLAIAVAPIMVACSWFSNSPALYMTFVKVILSFLSLSVVAVGFLWGRRIGGLNTALITGALCGVWFELVQFAPAMLSCIISTHILIISIYLVYPGEIVESKRRFFAAGLLMGLGVAVRIQLGPVAFLLAIYVCRNLFHERWLPLAAGGLIGFIVSGMVDLAGWSFPFQGNVHYFYLNVIKGRARSFGTMPWYEYFKVFIRHWSIVTIPMFILFLLGWRKNLLLGLLAGLVVVVHSFFDHKEYRFIYAAIPFVIILIGVGTAEVVAAINGKLKAAWKRRIVCALSIGMWVIISSMLAIRPHYRALWVKSSNQIKAFEFLHRMPDVCGVGTLGIWWAHLAGYTYLHKDVPIIVLCSREELDRHQKEFNYLVTSKPLQSNKHFFNLVSSWDTKVTTSTYKMVYLYKRKGQCIEPGIREINTYLECKGM